MTELEKLKAAAKAATLEQAERRHSAFAASADAANARSADATAAKAAAWSVYDAAYDFSCDCWRAYFAELNKHKEKSDD